MKKLRNLIIAVFLLFLLFTFIKTIVGDVSYSKPVSLMFSIRNEEGDYLEDADITIYCSIDDKVYATGPDVEYGHEVYFLTFRCRPHAPAIYAYLPKKDISSIEIILQKHGYQEVRVVYPADELSKFLTTETEEGSRTYHFPDFVLEKL